VQMFAREGTGRQSVVSDWTAQVVRGKLGPMWISPLMFGLGLAWLLIVLVLSIDVMRRSSRQEATRRVHPRYKRALMGRSGEIEDAPTASWNLTPVGGDGHVGTGQNQVAVMDAQHRLGDTPDPIQGADGRCSARSSIQAARCTVTRHGDGCQAEHDATYVETHLKGAGDEPAEFGLFLVADGGGGGPNGTCASRVAVEHIAQRVMSALAGGFHVPSRLFMSLFKYAVMQVGDALLAQDGPKCAETSLMVTGVLVIGKSAYIVNAGSCRTYLWNPKRGLRQLTVAPARVPGMVSAGPVYPEALDVSPLTQQLYASLGDENEPMRVDTVEVSIHPGDQFLLCSDGLWRHTCTSELETILHSTADLHVATQVLIRKASENGSQDDDVSAILVRFQSGGLAEDHPP
jgi:serine/threonine protein phosphatase PrpC